MMGCAVWVAGLTWAPAATATTVTVTATGLPPWSYGSELAITGQPLWLRIAAARLMSSEGRSLVLTVPFTMQSVTLGPAFGLGQAGWPPTCADGTGVPCPTNPTYGPVEFAAGFMARYDARGWWLAVAPTVYLLPRPPLLPKPGTTDAPLPQPPFLDAITTLAAGPPLLEVGWKPTSHLAVSLRMTLAPLAVSWTF